MDTNLKTTMLSVVALSVIESDIEKSKEMFAERRRVRNAKLKAKRKADKIAKHKAHVDMVMAKLFPNRKKVVGKKPRVRKDSEVVVATYKPVGTKEYITEHVMELMDFKTPIERKIEHKRNQLVKEYMTSKEVMEKGIPKDILKAACDAVAAKFRSRGVGAS